ncbi:MAG: MBL fold metallo-hydrolase [Burkholderiaceae bacterium]|nr:MAG: MBL fold metallo-hydrolase [Burkholderiaceae bacterium]
MRFTILGSGSEGNGLVVEAGAAHPTRILVDCGFGLRDLIARLARVELTPEQIDAIVLTHEHDDHASGAFKFAHGYDIPVWLTAGTLRGCRNYLRDGVRLRPFDAHLPFVIGDLTVQPVAVPHDACEPTQFVFSDGVRRLGLLTDAGRPTAHITAAFSGVDALILECNHDVQMLAQSRYPESLKRRIGGEFGHLSNTEAGTILASLDRSKLKHVIAAHLSQVNNTPLHARNALAEVLSCKVDEVEVACQADGLGWRALG